MSEKEVGNYYYSELLKRLGDKLYKVDDQVGITFNTDEKTLLHKKVFVSYRGVKVLEVYAMLGTYLKFDNKKAKRWSSVDWNLDEASGDKKTFNHVVATLKRNLKTAMKVVDEGADSQAKREKINSQLHKELLDSGFQSEELEPKWYGVSVKVDENEENNIDLFGGSSVDVKIPVGKLKQVLELLAS